MQLTLSEMTLILEAGVERIAIVTKWHSKLSLECLAELLVLFFPVAKSEEGTTKVTCSIELRYDRMVILFLTSYS